MDTKNKSNLSSYAINASNSRIELNALLNAFNSGNFLEAERLSILMTKSFPDNYIAWKSLGLSLKIMKRFSEAIIPLKKSLELMPEDIETQMNLGIVLTELSAYKEAEIIYRKVIEMKPDYAEAHLNLGVVLKYQGKNDEAANCYRRAIEIKPDFAESYNNLAIVLQDAGNITEAEACFRRAIELKPNYAESYNNMGNLLNDIGKIEEAKELYIKALSIKPDFVACHRNLAQIKTFTKNDPQLETLNYLYESHKNDSDKIEVCFALAKACEDLNKIDRAFDFYAEGNRLMKKKLHYNIEQDISLFKNIKSLFRKVPKTEQIPLKKVKPIMIVGMPRSGTSLVEQILASHSEVFGGGELDALDRLVKKYFLKAKESCSIEERCRLITAGYLDEIDKLTENGKKYFTDKMPLNFRWLGFIMLSQPDIKIVHVVRNPEAVCWSNFKQLFSGTGAGFAYDLKDIYRYYQIYKDLMEFWQELFPGRIYNLNYEKLTQNQKEETKKLLDYCGLNWENGCMEFEKNKRAVRTASFAQVRKKMYQGSSEEWKKFRSRLEGLIE